MSRSPDLFPPIIAGFEKEYVLFDFGLSLNTGVTLTSISEVLVYSLDGNDTLPNSRILNAPALASSPTTLLANQAVMVLFGNSVPSLYLLQCVAQTSDGQTLSCEVRWQSVNPTP